MSYSGAKVIGGDFNGDGYSDVLIGADFSNIGDLIHAGMTYLIFGKSEVGKEGLVHLSDLDGVNGFKLYGESAYDQAGLSISSIGDINGDKVVDFAIGARNASRDNLMEMGIIYVVFGDVSPVLVNNSLVINQGQTVPIDNRSLLVTDTNHNASQIFFTSAI